MTGFHTLNIHGCKFYSRPRLVADGIAKFQAANPNAVSGFLAGPVLESQAYYLSQMVSPTRENLHKGLCGRLLVHMSKLEEDV